MAIFYFAYSVARKRNNFSILFNLRIQWRVGNILHTYINLPKSYVLFLPQSQVTVTDNMIPIFAIMLSCNKLFYNRGNLVDVDDTRAYSDTQKIFQKLV